MTRSYDPVAPPVALTIAGSDSGGGAGIQADLKTMTAHGVFGASVVTATTAQNSRGVHDVHPIPADHVASQYDAVVDDYPVAAIKTGMLATAETIEAVTARVAGFDGPVVVDPVMVAATGDRLLPPSAEAAYDDLVAEATVVTPNADEAAVFVGEPVETAADAAAAGRELVARGASAALIKGGHLTNGVDDAAVAVGSDVDDDIAADERGVDGDDSRVVDTLVVDDGGNAPAVHRSINPRIDTDATHGSGCTLSSAIAARVAREEPLVDAVAAAVDEMGEAIRRGYDLGTGPGAVNPTTMDS